MGLVLEGELVLLGEGLDEKQELGKEGDLGGDGLAVRTLEEAEVGVLAARAGTVLAYDLQAQVHYVALHYQISQSKLRSNSHILPLIPLLLLISRLRLWLLLLDQMKLCKYED